MLRENDKVLDEFFVNLPRYFKPDMFFRPFKDPDILFSRLDEWNPYYQEVDEDCPDWTFQDAKESLKTGKVTVYSILPIKKGTPVSPSKKYMEDYGEPKFSKTLKIHDIAWSSNMLGQPIVGD